MEEEIPEDDDYEDDFEDRPKALAKKPVEPTPPPAAAENDRDRINRIMQERAAKLNGSTIQTQQMEEPKKKYPWE
jgi:hypothetical protein